MSDEFLRYHCQMALPGFSEQAQRRLQNARVLVVGAGGLGCPAAQYLAAAGVGTLGLADFDVVSIGNLHRQILFTPEDAGKKKAGVACERLQKQNPDIVVVCHDMKVAHDNVRELLTHYDLVVDATDNFDARYLLNDAAVLAGKPVVYGAIYQFEGQAAVWNLENEDGSRTPNYRDLFPDVDATQIPNCAQGGVIPTLAGIIGCIQANEVIKYITRTGEMLAGKVLVFDAQTLQSRIIHIRNTTNTHITSLRKVAEVPVISAAELKKALADDAVELVDVRSVAERGAFHIGGEHVQLEDIPRYAEKMDVSSPKVFYCGSGKRSAEAVKAIRNKYPDAPIYSLDGGLEAWLEFNG